MRKIEINEDDFKKILLLLKHSKEFVVLDPKNLFLKNLWRIAPKLSDKLAKKNGYEFVENKGRKSVKPIISEEPEKEEPKPESVESPDENPDEGSVF